MPTLVQGNSIGEVAHILHAAVVLGPSAWGREPMPEAHMLADIEERLKSQLVELFRILNERKIPYLLVGGIAMLTYIDGRNTDDVDLVLSVDSLATLPEVTVADKNRDFAQGMFGALRVDFLLTENPLFLRVQQSYSVMYRFLETDIHCATIEGLILLKLFALPSLYRQGRSEKIFRYEADIAILYQLARPNMQPLYADLKPMVDRNQFGELENIVAEIKQRIARVDRAKNLNP